MINSRLERAIVFASKAHLNQFRKQTDVPYISHPVAVAMILMRAACDEDVVIAGLLHDTLEESCATPKQIRDEFGRRVLELVEAATEPKRSAPWEDRKSHTIEALRQAPKDLKLLIAADKLHNLMSMDRDYQQIGEQLWQRFNRGFESQKWYYHSLLSSLDQTKDGFSDHAIFQQFRTLVFKMFGTLSNHSPKIG